MFVQPYRGWIELARPASTVSAVQWLLWDNAPESLQTSDYAVDVDSEPARIRLLKLPSLTANIRGLKVEFTSGYGDDATAIPEPIKHAVKLIFTSLNENRGDTDFKLISEAVESLLSPYRLTFFG
nr:hypothetical protein [Siccirubricoccus soli]